MSRGSGGSSRGHGPRPKRDAAARPGPEALESRLRETAVLLEVARVASSTTDFAEALRLICRELARLTGAETVAAYAPPPAGRRRVPFAACHVPKPRLAVLSTSALAVAEQRGFDAVCRSGHIIWSADLPRAPRFSVELFRRFPHQSGLVIPLSIDG